MNKKAIVTMMFALAFASCRPTARQAVADVVQPTDSTERILKLPLDSIVVEMMNNTDSTCVTGEAYTIEQRVNGEWTVLPFKPRKDGAVYAFNDIGYELAPHSSRLFTIHVEPDKYDFERGQEYRIVKELFKSKQSNPQCVYCYFIIE